MFVLLWLKSYKYKTDVVIYSTRNIFRPFMGLKDVLQTRNYGLKKKDTSNVLQIWILS